MSSDSMAQLNLSAQLTIRPGKPDEGAQLLQIRLEAERISRREILPIESIKGSQEILEKFCLSSDFSDEVTKGDVRYLVAELNGNRVAFSRFSIVGDDSRCCHYKGIFLLPKLWGTGIAVTLMNQTFEEIKSIGDFDSVMVWVLEEDPRARRFYEKCGFVLTGDRHQISTGGPMEHPIVKYMRQFKQLNDPERNRP